MEKEFLSQNLCVCVCLRILVPEFWSKNFVFGKELLSYNQNFVFEKRIFGFIVCNWNFVFGKRIFVPEFCVSVSQNFCFFGKRTYFVTGILKRKVFLHVKSECF